MGGRRNPAPFFSLFPLRSISPINVAWAISTTTSTTGSGKTTTLAALVNEINKGDPRHIVTIEDPIEYEHTHLRSVVEQVEIGVDATDFPTALRAAPRQAPDVIVVGEMRDPETMRIALSAAETGHLVFATVHTTDVAATVSRITDGFPSERQNAVRQEFDSISPLRR